MVTIAVKESTPLSFCPCCADPSDPMPKKWWKLNLQENFKVDLSVSERRIIEDETIFPKGVLTSQLDDNVMTV